MNFDQTIYALASGAGRCGVAVIRLSGPHALDVLCKLSNKDIFKPRYAHRVNLVDPLTGDQLDDGLALYFPGPNSFTGEDVVELQIHGGRAVVQSVQEALASFDGLRLAEPGEFTRRAFENDKMDLTAAEGLADLIHAETRAQAKQALRQMDGALGSLYNDWADRILHVLAHFEAVIDFPDEDLPEEVEQGVRAKVDVLKGEIEDHLKDGHRGEMLRDGVRLAIVGPPNAGKSSLLNHLAKREVAIVSDIAGTTRDVIESHLDIGGYPVVVSDTAGIRHSDDVIEVEGIRRAQTTAQQADLKVVLFDSSDWPDLDGKTLDLIDEDCLLVFNKIDKADKPDITDVKGITPLYMSAKSGEGLSDFFKALEKEVAERCMMTGAPALTRARHREALEDCVEALNRFDQIDLPELAAEDLRMATRSLGRITGRIDVEDVLDIVFSDFCIGK
ncbi:tRNA uridine-5-carboxymethylaminomethyl(34) synthesis GTPase MnmE [Terasakiella sp. A23]|uniref:tRNA uridine-5-carboxymethylaminomethyl(34) synthesis GTPase MnmE n=1 Tax=Terasakiella sp. FCG-A23 TaxID=3080561 RepID=UPI00295376D6|nr:tRNA uridine-5-carboxymethylaminomethyl(34) synthesis GTPase MnmE [Terasakiella sp. A23]MDV7339874.1 tRNA uridine-5-carboxymethylaminomethyl(34) synthesis GTPase MnmE [Terasakiella sp. A23]